MSENIGSFIFGTELHISLIKEFETTCFNLGRWRESTIHVSNTAVSSVIVLMVKRKRQQSYRI